MFYEIRRSISIAEADFKENVQDQFGLSIITEVYDPYISELIASEQMEEQLERTINEIDQILENARSIQGCNSGY